MSNPYEVLGIEPTATADEIKSAYRKAAMKHHPDRNGNSPESLEKFREVQEAYETLTKPKAQSSQSNYGNPFEGHPFSWAFHEFTNRRSNRNYNAYASITLEQAYNGCELSFTNENRVITVRVPKGVQHGQTIRVSGEGSREFSDLPAGDLFLIIEIAPHPEFEYGGVHLQKRVEVDMLDLILGSEIEVTTISGEVVKIKIPPNTSPMHKLRVVGKGMPFQDQFGDLYLVLKPVVPNLNDELRQQLESIRAASKSI